MEKEFIKLSIDEKKSLFILKNIRDHIHTWKILDIDVPKVPYEIDKYNIVAELGSTIQNNLPLGVMQFRAENCSRTQNL